MNLDSGIARLARDLVRAQIEATAEHEGESEYRSLCERLPILLRTAGLTRTVAFLDAKKKDRSGRPTKEGELLEHLRRQLQGVGVYDDPNQRVLEDLPGMVTRPDTTTAYYCHISRLAFRMAYWHKRLAQALLQPGEGGR